jgi:CheY-like chemotaxis protein
MVCSKLVELMGGAIEVQSKEGTGSTFSFTIPLAPSPKPLTPHARHQYMHHLEGKRVLFVDINTAFAQVLQPELRNWKLVPAIAQPGNHLPEAKNADVVIVDIDAASGSQSAATIRAQYPSLPIIGLTKNISNTTEPGNNSITAFIAKPVKQMPLLDKLLDLFIPAATQDATPPATELFATRYPLRILIAEDNPVNQKIARKILGKLGYNPDIANHGKEAMEMVGQSAYDLILMDVQMPHMNGLEATRMIRTCLDLQPVIIALTANAMQGDRDECRQAGMDDYMSKPIDVNELMRQLEKWSLVIRDRRRLSA